MPSVKFSEVRSLLGKHDLLLNNEGPPRDEETEELRQALNAYFDGREAKYCVAGIDIYRYSDMPGVVQRLVPTLFQSIYDVATGLCAEGEKFLFQKGPIKGRFVSTGDGGFQILESPLHAIAFAIFFELALAAYNGFYVFPRLRQIVGALSVRYAITYDTLFEQDGNFFGAAII